MNVVSAIVLYAVIWFLVLFVILPIRLETQGDRGEIEPGTHAGAPANFEFGKKMRLVTVIAAAVWVVIAGIIISGVISVRDIDWFERMDPETLEPE
jgi:predicted secreted protein